jgi:hypothetical protein
VAKESHQVCLNNLVNPSKIIKLTSSIILERSEQGMARAEKRDKEVKDDSLDLDDRREAKAGPPSKWKYNRLQHGEWLTIPRIPLSRS